MQKRSVVFIQIQALPEFLMFNVFVAYQLYLFDLIIPKNA